MILLNVSEMNRIRATLSSRSNVRQGGMIMINTVKLILLILIEIKYIDIIITEC